jgi:pSer/pThr/pTyr-binding forkhead associated (FHA) protein
MKLKELMEAVRGLDDKAFLARFPNPFLLEEGLLRHETRSFAKPGEGDASRWDELSERQTFPIRRRDGKVGDVALGRGALMDIKLDAQSVSSRHAVFKPPGDGRSRWVVVDTVSTNGTFVDGVRIATGREVELSEATVLRFGPDLRLAFYESSQLLQVLRNVATAQSAAPARPPSSPIPASVSKLPALPTLRKEPGADSGDLDQALVETDVIRREDLAKAVTKRESPSGSGIRPSLVQRPQPAAARLAGVGGPGSSGRPGNDVGTKTETDLSVPEAPPLLARPPRAAGPSIVGPEAVVVLSCDPFAPLPLELHRPVCIGRVPGNDFVLPNPQVSRRHCEVERVREGVVVRDLKSANGTFFEERRIERQTVPFNGIFRIGPYALEVRCLDPVASTAPTFGDTLVSAKGKADGLRGTFEDMPLTEIVSGVEFNQKTGVIDIQGEDGTAGFVSFRGGVPHQARCGKLEGEPAVLALLRIKHGRFVLRSDEAAVGPRGIEVNFTKLLLEHGRLSDEGSRQGA